MSAITPEQLLAQIAELRLRFQASASELERQRNNALAELANQAADMAVQASAFKALRSEIEQKDKRIAELEGKPAEPPALHVVDNTGSAP